MALLAQSTKFSYCDSDKSYLKKLTLQQKIEILRDFKITYPKMLETLDLIEECRCSPTLYERPRCMRISGPSGVGKTTICTSYIKKFEKSGDSNISSKPVFYARVPCPAHIGGLPDSILNSLGDPLYGKGSNISARTARLYSLLRACNVELIFLDEVQHLVDPNSQRLLKDSSDWFKELIDQTHIPVIFIGTPVSKKIFLEHEQLSNRVDYSMELSPFTYSSDFLGFLLAFDGLLPLAEYSGLAEPEMSRRIFSASNGLLINIHKLLIDATHLALKSNYEKITLPLLASAYQRLNLYKNVVNPFVTE